MTQSLPKKTSKKLTRKTKETGAEEILNMQLQVANHFPCPIYYIERPDFLKTVSMVSSMFGVLMDKEDKSKVNAQKKRFFDNVQGLSFPEDWDTLPEEEKTKRLEKIENFNLNR